MSPSYRAVICVFLGLASFCQSGAAGEDMQPGVPAIITAASEYFLSLPGLSLDYTFDLKYSDLGGIVPYQSIFQFKSDGLNRFKFVETVRTATEKHPFSDVYAYNGNVYFHQTPQGDLYISKNAAKIDYLQALAFFPPALPYSFVCGNEPIRSLADLTGPDLWMNLAASIKPNGSGSVENRPVTCMIVRNPPRYGMDPTFEVSFGKDTGLFPVAYKSSGGGNVSHLVVKKLKAIAWKGKELWMPIVIEFSDYNAAGIPLGTGGAIAVEEASIAVGEKIDPANFDVPVASSHSALDMDLGVYLKKP